MGGPINMLARTVPTSIGICINKGLSKNHQNTNSKQLQKQIHLLHMTSLYRWLCSQWLSQSGRRAMGLSLCHPCVLAAYFLQHTGITIFLNLWKEKAMTGWSKYKVTNWCGAEQDQSEENMLMDGWSINLSFPSSINFSYSMFRYIHVYIYFVELWQTSKSETCFFSNNS